MSRRKGLVNWNKQLTDKPVAKPSEADSQTNLAQSIMGSSGSQNMGINQSGFLSQSTTMPEGSVPMTPALTKFQTIIQIHDTKFTCGIVKEGTEIYLSNNEVFEINDLIEITPQIETTVVSDGIEVPKFMPLSTKQDNHTPRQSLIIVLQKGFYKEAPNYDKKKLVVSIGKTIAELHGLTKNMPVNVRKIHASELSVFGKNKQKNTNENKQKPVFGSMFTPLVQLEKAYSLVCDRVEVTVRDQFVSRRDMWQFVQLLNNKSTYKGNQIEYEGVRFKIRNIYTTLNPNMKTTQNQQEQESRQVEQKSAVVMTSHSKFSFFTKSSQVYILVEMSKEMYEFDGDGYLQSEKCEMFLRSYFERCKVDASTHEVVVILYGRLFYPGIQEEKIREIMLDNQKEKGMGAFQISHNKLFQDVYLKAGVVTMDTGRNSWTDFLLQFKKHVRKFPSLVNWKINVPQNVKDLKSEPINEEQEKPYLMPSELADSDKCNILEAINLALFNQNNAEIDINLRTTGTYLMILTAGCATYRVNSDIISPTKSRILLGGIPVHMISFAKEPPYKTPLLIKCCSYQNPFRRETSSQRPFSSQINVVHHDVNQATDKKHFLLDWIQASFLHHVKLLETHICFNKEHHFQSISKVPLIASQFNGLQQTAMERKVFGLSKQEKLFEPHSIFKKLQSVESKNKQIPAEEKKAEPGHTKRGIKTFLICPDDYELLPVPEERATDQSRKLVLSHLMDEFDKIAITGSEDKKQNVNRTINSLLQKSGLTPVKEFQTPIKMQSQGVYNTKGTEFNADKTSRKLDAPDSCPFKVNILQADKKDQKRIEPKLPNQMVKKSSLFVVSQHEKQTKQSSFCRRWSHAINVIQYNISAKTTSLGGIKSLSFDQNPVAGGNVLKENPLQLALTQNQYEPLQKLMDSFWKQLTDIKLLPLTTEYYHEQNQKSKKYNNDPGILIDTRGRNYEHMFQENLCLRLTQNFQFVSPDGTCEFSISNNNQDQYRVAFRDRYALCRQIGDQGFESKTIFKYKNVNESLTAQFKYLLFNYHTNDFQVKNSQENRLFKITSLNNLDEVQDDLTQAPKSCVKLPQISLVIYYDKAEKQKQKELKKKEVAEDNESNTQLATEGETVEDTKQNNEAEPQDSEDEEVQEFTKLKDGIFEMLSKQGQSKRNTKYTLGSLRNIKIKKRREVKNENCLVHASINFQHLSPNFNGVDLKLRPPRKISDNSDMRHQSTVSQVSHFVPGMQGQQQDFFIQGQIQGSFLGMGYGANRDDVSQGSNRSRISSMTSNDALNQTQQAVSPVWPTTKQSFFSKENIGDRTFNIGQPRMQNKKQDFINKEKGSQCIITIDDNQPQPSQHDDFANDEQRTTRATFSKQKRPIMQEMDKYLLEHDQTYITGKCFHLKFYWIFSRGPLIQEGVIKRFTRRIKELTDGCFKVLPISAIIRNQELNPFESTITLRESAETQATKKKNSDVMEEMCVEQVKASMKEDEEMMMFEYDAEDDANQANQRAIQIENRLSRRIKEHSIYAHEEAFREHFPRILIQQCNFVLESKSQSRPITNYLEKDIGLSYVRVHTDNTVTFSENDIVNNMQGDYSASVRNREKVLGHIFALDILLEIIMEKLPDEILSSGRKCSSGSSDLSSK